MADVDELAVEINLKVNEAIKALENFQKELKQTAKTAEQAGEASENAAGAAVAKWGFIGAAVAGAAMLIKKGVDSLIAGEQRAVVLSNTIDKVENSVGLSGKNLQRLDYIFKQHKGNVETLISSYQHLQDMQARAQYSGYSQEENFAFSKLGINPSSYTNTKDLLEAITKSLLKIDNIGERNMLARKLGIDVDFLRVAAKGKYYINDLANLTEEEEQNILAWQQEINAFAQDMDRTWTKLGAGFISKVGLPVMQWINKWSREIQRDWFGENPEEKLPKLNLNENQKRVMQNVADELRAGGLSPNAVYGILGNLMQESSFDPLAENKGHRGLAQWDKERWANYIKFAKANHLDAYDERSQAKFIIHELKNRKVKGTNIAQFDAMNSSATIRGAASAFQNIYEVAPGQQDERRISYGQQLYSQLPYTPIQADPGLINTDNLITPATQNILNDSRNNINNININNNIEAKEVDGELMYNLTDNSLRDALKNTLGSGVTQNA